MSQVIKHFEKRLVPYNKPFFFNVVANVEEYHNFLPWCTESKILHQFGPNKFDASLSVGFKLFSEEYVSRVDLTPHRHIVVRLHSSPLLKQLSTVWTFEDAQDRPEDVVMREAREEGKPCCLVTFDVSFQFRNSLHSEVAQLFFKEVHKRMLSAFLARAESLAQHDDYGREPKD